MMNKKLLISILVLAVIFMLGSFVQAKEYIATADFNDMDPKVIHDSPRVDTVISCNMVLKPKTQAHFSRLCNSAVSNVKYYFNDNNSENDIKKGPDYTGIVSDEVFYPASNRIPNSYIGGTISYKVGCDFQTKKSNGERILKEVPEDSYQTAVIISSITKQVDLGVATTVSVPTGDQSQPDWVGISDVIPGCEGITADWIYRFGSVSGSDVSGVSSVSRVKSNKVLILSGVNAATFTNSVNEGHVYYTNASQSSNLNDEQMAICRRAKKLIMEYNENQNACDDATSQVLIEEGWQPIDTSQEQLLKVTSTGIEYPKFINAWGRIYAVIEEQNAGTCRPIRRTIVKGRIGTKYPGFEFPNTDNGDVVKIFNVNGKKIAEVSGDNSGKIVWNGRKDNGDWAKSGIYIYQIKVKETGKLISGTIVFVY